MVLKTLKEVFRNYRYILIALIFAFVIFSFSLWLRNLPLFGNIIGSPAFSFFDKVTLFAKFLGGIATNVTLFSAALIVIMSMLFGINASLFLYYLVKRRGFPKKEGVGALGAFASGMLGVGCASCGSLLLGAALASFGASGLIGFLPLRGEEFSIFAIILLGLSIYWISKSIQTSKICKL
jgi:hypothetical protein